jgi:hypothetical protein
MFKYLNNGQETAILYVYTGCAFILTGNSTVKVAYNDDQGTG